MTVSDEISGLTAAAVAEVARLCSLMGQWTGAH
jgi:hypothetical protein